jgi:F-type H+-transporting ATPase subunit d
MSLAKQIDWASLTNKLRPETSATLSAFRRRHQDLQANITDLKVTKKEIDFDSYRNILQNKTVVDEAELALRYFVPKKVETLDAQLKAIDEAEIKAVSNIIFLPISLHSAPPLLFPHSPYILVHPHPLL